MDSEGLSNFVPLLAGDERKPLIARKVPVTLRILVRLGNVIETSHLLSIISPNANFLCRCGSTRFAIGPGVDSLVRDRMTGKVRIRKMLSRDPYPTVDN